MSDSTESTEKAEFSPELKQQFFDAVLGKLKQYDQMKCSVCGSNSWTWIGKLTFPNIQEYEPGPSVRMMLGGENLPSIPIICITCGNTLFLNVYILLKDEAKSFPPFDKSGGG
jgi:hypothetical protein